LIIVQWWYKIGSRNHQSQEATSSMAHVEKTIEVQKPVDQVYAQWTQFENFPQFMENVQQVRQLDDKHLEWKAKVAGTERQWKAEIVEQQPNRVIAWRATTGDKNAGKVEFEPV